MSEPKEKKDVSLNRGEGRPTHFSNASDKDAAPPAPIKGRDASFGESAEHIKNRIVRAKDDLPPAKKE
jgi:hypothetical protein